MTEYPLGDGGSQPVAITAGPGDSIWITEHGRLGRIDPRTHKVVHYPVGFDSSGLAVARDQTLWLTDQIGGSIHQLNRDGQTIGVYPIAAPRSMPAGITTGPDGAVWFTEFGSDTIGRIDPVTHEITEDPTPTHFSAPDGITAGPDGNLWFTEFTANSIARIEPRNHAITEYRTLNPLR